MTMGSKLTQLSECALSGTKKLLTAELMQREFGDFDDNALYGSNLTSISFSNIDSDEVL